MKPTTKKTTVKLGASAVLATGITLASRFDLAISSALAGLAQTENVFTLSVPKFAALLEIIGEWAPSLLAATSVLIVGQESADLCPDRNMTAKLSSFVPATALMAYATTKTMEYLKYSVSGALSAALIASVAFTVAAMLYLLIGIATPIVGIVVMVKSYRNYISFVDFVYGALFFDILTIIPSDTKKSVNAILRFL